MPSWQQERMIEDEKEIINGYANSYDGNLLDDRTGVPLEYQIYYQINGKDFDCCTLTSALSARDMQDLEEFVKMYR